MTTNHCTAHRFSWTAAHPSILQVSVRFDGIREGGRVRAIAGLQVTGLQVTRHRGTRHRGTGTPGTGAPGSANLADRDPLWSSHLAPSPEDTPYAAGVIDAHAQTPPDAFEMLLAGNRRFIAGTQEHPNQDAARRTQIAPEQRPFAVLFGCSDSRLAAEIIFDRGLGDLFVVRTAGHVMDPAVLGSIEYGVSVLGCPLVVVLGHDACGAVAASRAAVQDGVTAGGYVRDVVERVTPSVLAAQAAGHTEDQQFIDEHVRHTVDLLLERSRVLADAVAANSLAVAGLSYRLSVGAAELFTARGLSAQ